MVMDDGDDDGVMDDIFYSEWLSLVFLSLYLGQYQTSMHLATL